MNSTTIIIVIISYLLFGSVMINISQVLQRIKEKKNAQDNIIPTPLPPAHRPPDEYTIAQPLTSNQNPSESPLLCNNAHVPEMANKVHDNSSEHLNCCHSPESRTNRSGNNPYMPDEIKQDPEEDMPETLSEKKIGEPKGSVYIEPSALVWPIPAAAAPDRALIALAGLSRKLKSFLDRYKLASDTEYVLVNSIKDVRGCSFDKAYILQPIPMDLYRALLPACRGNVEFV